MAESTRRNAIKRGLLAIGGLVGLGAAAGKALPSPGGALPGRSFVLHARNLDPLSGGLRTDGPPARGQSLAAHAELLDGPNGRRVGDLHVATIALRGPGSSSDADRFEWHTFRLAEGTIVGSGTGGADGGVFAVVGGTGRYEGARGTYAVRRLDPDGSVEFAIDLLC